ncbi:hypothetical protein B0H16DRAFT_1791969, partial [Mycena metata]
SPCLLFLPWALGTKCLPAPLPQQDLPGWRDFQLHEPSRTWTKGLGVSTKLPMQLAQTMPRRALPCTSASISTMHMLPMSTVMSRASEQTYPLSQLLHVPTGKRSCMLITLSLSRNISHISWWLGQATRFSARGSLLGSLPRWAAPQSSHGRHSADALGSFIPHKHQPRLPSSFKCPRCQRNSTGRPTMSGVPMPGRFREMREELLSRR